MKLKNWTCSREIHKYILQCCCQPAYQKKKKSCHADSKCLSQNTRWLLAEAILMLFKWYLHHTLSCHALFPACLVCVFIPQCVFPVSLCVSRWCSINPNNHPTVMREMRFPLNNSRPVRFADPQPLRQLQNKHSSEERHLLAACIYGSARTSNTHGLRQVSHNDTVLI